MTGKRPGLPPRKYNQARRPDAIGSPGNQRKAHQTQCSRFCPFDTKYSRIPTAKTIEISPVMRPINNDIPNGEAKVSRFFRTVNEMCGNGSNTLHRRVIDQISKLASDRQVMATSVHRSTVAKRMNVQTNGSRFFARERSSGRHKIQATPSPINKISNPCAPACRLVAAGSVSRSCYV